EVEIVIEEEGVSVGEVLCLVAGVDTTRHKRREHDEERHERNQPTILPRARMPPSLRLRIAHLAAAPLRVWGLRIADGVVRRTLSEAKCVVHHRQVRTTSAILIARLR